MHHFFFLRMGGMPPNSPIHGCIDWGLNVGSGGWRHTEGRNHPCQVFDFTGAGVSLLFLLASLPLPRPFDLFSNLYARFLNEESVVVCLLSGISIALALFRFLHLSLPALIPLVITTRPSTVTIHVTGFKKFHGVSENPTEIIVTNLKGFMQKKGLPEGLVLGSCNVLETAGEGVLPQLHEVFQTAFAGQRISGGTIITKFDYADCNSSICLIFCFDISVVVELIISGFHMNLHLGVNSGATRFAIENQAVNEATFRCPDEMGWKPQKVAIVPSDGSISHVRETSLPVNEIVKNLSKMGYDVMPSDDAGRFVCNFVYYHSLLFAEHNRIKSLFVHVPLFSTIDEETQMEFVASLLKVLASLHSNYSHLSHQVRIDFKTQR
ncbi:Pyroglutamyl peptidase [Musa troglodytarum]|uniref:Pyroglutamyl peptidase n=1 Tax=Musa troglodytarum TaxID=320322 RepID=A0A9E7ERX6_9LILI|nr:Pyroglutamyl peptidase [Musa troglodytarum]